MSSLRLTAAFTPVEGGWVQGRCLELPGVITAAPTLGEAQEGMVDALHEYLSCSPDELQQVAGESGPVGLEIVLVEAAR